MKFSAAVLLATCLILVTAACEPDSGSGGSPTYAPPPQAPQPAPQPASPPPTTKPPQGTTVAQAPSPSPSPTPYQRAHTFPDGNHIGREFGPAYPRYAVFTPLILNATMALLKTSFEDAPVSKRPGSTWTEKCQNLWNDLEAADAQAKLIADPQEAEAFKRYMAYEFRLANRMLGFNELKIAFPSDDEAKQFMKANWPATMEPTSHQRAVSFIDFDDVQFVLKPGPSFTSYFGQSLDHLKRIRLVDAPVAAPNSFAAVIPTFCDTLLGRIVLRVSIPVANKWMNIPITESSEGDRPKP